jgi:HEPN domain-containing protein
MDRARLDLRLARLASPDETLAGLVAFHCQQAAEKALKAFLASMNQPLYKTHDLPALLARCRALDQGFDALEEAAEALDVYLMVGRYPDTGPSLRRPTTVS